MSTPLPLPYSNPTPYPELSERFEDSWVKILPVRNRTVFASELVELQDVLRYQQHKLFSALYSTYSVVQGLTLSRVSANETEHVLFLSAGQIYWAFNGLGYFLDIPEQAVTVDATLIEVTIGVIVDRTIELGPGDPMDGGSEYGSQGALRERLTPRVVTQSADAYPLAVYTPASQTILYFRNNQFRTRPEANPALLEEAVREVFSEDIASFIAEGLEVQIEGKTLSVSGGRAYVNGTPVWIKTATYFEVYGTDPLFLVLNSQGMLQLYPYFTQEQLVIGQVVNYRWSPSQVRLPSVRQLLQVEALHERNQRELIELSIIKNQRLINTGFLFDNFNSLDFSDINHPLYSAAWVPALPAMQAGVFATPLNWDVLELLSNDGVQITEPARRSRILLPDTIDQVEISQPLATGVISLQQSLSPKLYLNPEMSQFQERYKVQLSNPLENVSFNQVVQLGQLADQVITVRAEGLSPLANNFRLEFGGTRVFNLQLLDGTVAGDQLDTLRANADGTAAFSFEVPANLPYQPYLVTLTNDNQTVQVLYGQIETEATLSAPRSAAAQSFSISSSLVSYGVNLAIANWPLNSRLHVKLVQYQDGQFGDSLAEGSLSQAALSSNGTAWSLVQWSRPVFLEPGAYAIQIEGIQNDIRLFIARVGERALNGAVSITDQPLGTGQLYQLEAGSWKAESSADLTFQLLKQVPSQLRSEAIFEVTNPQAFINNLALDLESYAPPNSQIQLEYLLNGQWRPLNGNFVSLPGNINTLSLKVIFSNIEDRFAWLDLGNSRLELQNTLAQSVWVSRTQTLETAYDHIEVSAIVFQSSGSQVRAYLSSNESQSWEEIPLTQTELVDATQPLNRLTWSKALTPEVTYADLAGTLYQRRRTKLTLRVDFENPEAYPGSPYIQNLRVLAD